MNLCSMKFGANVVYVFSLADHAASIAKPGSQLEAELRQDTYNTVPPQGGVEQDSGTSLPDAPGLPAQNKSLIDPSDDHEMPPLILDDDEEFPSVKEILYRTASNIDPKRTKHIIVDPTKINNPVAAQASQVCLFGATLTSLVSRMELQHNFEEQSGTFNFDMPPKYVS